MRCFHGNQAGRTAGGAAAAAILVIAGVLAACGGGAYGRLIGKTGLEQENRRQQVGPDYEYYKTPATAVPNAIIAIHKNYSLKSAGWAGIGTRGGTPESWRVYRGSMGLAPLLLEIQGPNGEHIGLWYSVWTSTVVKLLDNNEVQVFPPYTESGPVRRDRE